MQSDRHTWRLYLLLGFLVDFASSEEEKSITTGVYDGTMTLSTTNTDDRASSWGFYMDFSNQNTHV